MGRVKGFHLKRIAKQLSGKYPGVFGADFSANKRALHSMGLEMVSKIEFNKLTGAITIIAKKKAKNARETEQETAPVEPVAQVASVA